MSTIISQVCVFAGIILEIVSVLMTVKSAFAVRDAKSYVNWISKYGTTNQQLREQFKATICPLMFLSVGVVFQGIASFI